MANFYIRDAMREKINRKVVMPCGSTPRDFQKLIKLDDKILPTICRIKRLEGKTFYLSRNGEWDNYKVADYEECEFVVYPNGGLEWTPILIALAVSLVVGVATYLLTPRPNLGLNQNNNDTSPTYDLTQQGNRVRLNQPKPIHYGTIRSYPDIWSNSWTESVNNKRIYHALLNMGYNYIEIGDHKIDDTEITAFSWVTINVRYPGNAPTVLFPAPQITSKEVRGILCEPGESGYYTLNDANDISKVQYVYLDFFHPQGFYYSGGINDRGTADVATNVNVNLASLPANIDGVIPANFLVFDQYDSIENGWWDYTGFGLAATRNIAMNADAEFVNGSVYISGGTYAGVRFRQARVAASLIGYKIFVRYDTSLTVNQAITTIRFTVQEIDGGGVDVGSPIVLYYDIQDVDKNPNYHSVTYAHTSSARLKITVVQGQKWRTGLTTYNFVGLSQYKYENNIQDRTEWIAMRGYMGINEATIPDQTLIEIKIQASDKLNDSNIGIFNFLGKVRLPVYNFGTNTWSTIQTNSPIWAWYDLLVNTKYGMRLNQDTIIAGISDYVDMDNLEEIHNSIVGLGIECNTRFDTSMSAAEMLAQICQPMRCITYQRGGKFLLARDEEKTSINGFFSRENIKEGSLTLELIPKNDFSTTWYRVTYYDSVTSKKETVDCVIPSALSASAQYLEPFEEVEFHTITSRLQAWKIGMFLAAQNKYRNELIKFSTDMEGFFPNPMDKISITHPMLTTSQSGYIQKVDGAIIYLSEPIAFNGYETGLISFKNLNGTCSPYYICKPCVNQYCVEIVKFDTATANYTAFPFLTQEMEPEKEETCYTFGLTESSMICIVKGISADGEKGASIEAVNHNPIVHMFDKAIHLLPDLGADYKIWPEFVVEPIDCIVNLATKTITVRWTGGGFNSYNVKYLFNNLGLESTITQNVAQGASPSTHTNVYVYVGEAPIRVLVVPLIDITISPSVVEDIDFMAKIAPIEII